MAIVKFRVEEFLPRLGAAVPVPAPLGEPVSQVRVRSVTAGEGNVRTGLWECTVGRWRRQVKQAEFCQFLEGECSFIPDAGDPVEIRPGDVVYFPANTAGTWDIRTTSRKIYIVFG